MAEQSPDQRPASAPLEPSRDVVMGKTGTTPVVLPDDPFDESLDDPFEEEEDEFADEVANEQPTASPDDEPDQSAEAPANRRSDGVPSRREPGARPNRRAADRSEGASRETRKPKKRRHSARIALVTLLVLALVLVGAAAGGFAWLRWFSADDAADFQGTWYLAGTSTPITITEDRIQLTDDVSYHYAIDPEAKTFELTFGNLVGGGRYRFSLDRQELALVDGRYNGNDILSDDFSWTVRALVAEAQGEELAPEMQVDKGVTLLSRTPAKTVSGLPVEDL